MRHESNTRAGEPSEKIQRNSELKSDESKPQAEASAGFASLSEQVKELRRKQRESGKSGITGAGDKNGAFASASEILSVGSRKSVGEHPYVVTSVKAELLTKEHVSPDKKEKPDKPNSSVKDSRSMQMELSTQKEVSPENKNLAKRVAQIDKAAETLLESAGQRFGKEEVASLNIAKGDVGAATSALLLGPAVCKFMGAEQTSLIGKQLVVFGIAPMFGAASEAHKQFSEHLDKTTFDGSSNFLIGTAIGAVLEKAHPAILFSAVIGGCGYVAVDQLASPEHKERNAKLAEINNKLKTCSNTELLNFADHTKTTLGPEYYKAAFDITTGGAGLPEGSTLGAGIKEETSNIVKQINFAKVAESFKGLGKECWDAMGVLANGGNQRRWAFAGVANDSFLAMSSFEKKVEPGILRMTGEASGGHPTDLLIKKLAAELEEHLKAPLFDSLESARAFNKELLDRRNTITIERIDQAKTLGMLEGKFDKQILNLRDEVVRLKPQAEKIELKPVGERSAHEGQILDEFYAAEDAVYEILTEKIMKQYGWDGKSAAMADSFVGAKSGAGTQREISNALKSLFDSGIEKNEYFQQAIKNAGGKSDRARDWISLPMPGHNAADMAGSDILLINKSTGEMYPIDVTEKTLCLRSGKMVDSRVTNSKLEFPDKNVPLERKHLVIGVADETTRDNLNLRLRQESPKLSRTEADKLLLKQRENELAEIIGKIVAQPSKLNVLETPLPSSSEKCSPTLMAYELWRFGKGLERLGYDEWKRVVDSSIRSLRTRYYKQARIPDYQGI